MSYVISCDQRHNSKVKLFMVDRSKCKASFWSDRLYDVKVFADIHAANNALSRIKFNNPKVITYKEAMKLETSNTKLRQGNLVSQSKDLLTMCEEKCNQPFGPWDEHKAFI